MVIVAYFMFLRCRGFNITESDLRTLISKELIRLSKPYGKKGYSQELLIGNIILNRNICELGRYCKHIVDHLDYFN